MKLKDASRDQQKAAFAHMKDSDGYLKTLESAEKASLRRSYILKKADLADDYEDKIYSVWNDKNLTHRQKLDRISKLKKEVSKKDSKLKSETIEKKTAASEISSRKEKELGRRLNPVVISKVPSGINKDAFNRLVLKRKLGSGHLIEHNDLYLTQKEYIAGVKLEHNSKFRGRKIDGTITEQPSGNNRESFNYLVKKKKRKGLYIRVDGILLPEKVYRKALDRKTRVKYPGWKKDKSYSDLKKAGIKLPPKGDYDKDGKINKEDCRPMNKKKQDIPIARFALFAARESAKAGEAGAKTYAAYKKSKMPEARMKRAKARIAQIKAKREAEEYEKKAKIEEKAYRKEHPKRFGIF